MFFTSSFSTQLVQSNGDDDAPKNISFDDFFGLKLKVVIFGYFFQQQTKFSISFISEPKASSSLTFNQSKSAIKVATSSSE